MMENWKVKLFIDGACPMCSKEGRFLKSKDKNCNLAFVDTSAPDFDPAKYGISSDPNRLIHAILPDGSVIRGMEVFRQAYHQIGLGWLIAPTGWPILKTFFDLCYAVFARNRKWIGKFISRGENNSSCSLNDKHPPY